MEGQKSHIQSDADIDQILRIAVNLPDQDSALSLRERLELSASELGVSPEQLAKAEAQWAEERSLQSDMEAYVQSAKSGFIAHLIPYLIVNSFMVISSLREGEFWFLFPLLGWGTGLFMHYQSVFARKSAQFKEEFDAWRVKQQKLRQK